MKKGLTYVNDKKQTDLASHILIKLEIKRHFTETKAANREAQYHN